MVWFFSECFGGGYGFSDTYLLQSLPCWFSGKESTYDAGDLGSVSVLGTSLGEGKGNPLQYSCLEIPWTKEPGVARVGHDLATKLPTATTTAK